MWLHGPFGYTVGPNSRGQAPIHCCLTQTARASKQRHCPPCRGMRTGYLCTAMLCFASLSSVKRRTLNWTPSATQETRRASAGHPRVRRMAAHEGGGGHSAVPGTDNVATGEANLPKSMRKDKVRPPRDMARNTIHGLRCASKANSKNYFIHWSVDRHCLEKSVKRLPSMMM